MASKNRIELAMFQKALAKRASQVEKAAVRKIQAASKAAHETVVLATPVDTGQARSNWLTRRNSPNRAVIDAHAPGKNLGRGELANAATAIALGRREIETVRIGDKLFITNNLDYIAALNRGTSMQTPANFFQRSFVAGIKAAARIRAF